MHTLHNNYSEFLVIAGIKNKANFALCALFCGRCRHILHTFCNSQDVNIYNTGYDEARKRKLNQLLRECITWIPLEKPWRSKKCFKVRTMKRYENVFTNFSNTFPFWKSKRDSNPNLTRNLTTMDYNGKWTMMQLTDYEGL